MERTATRPVARRVLLVAVAVLLLVPGGGPVSAAPPRSRIAWAASDGIWTSDSVGGDRKHLVGTGAFDDRAYNPRWSHDGQWIAFMRRWAIWVVRADGSDAHVVPTRTRANLPQWSADDRRIYYFLEDGNPGIHWVSVDGSTWGSLTGGDPGRANSLVWSPDGRSGAISVLSDGNYAVATTDASGGNRTVILAEAGTHFSATAWSPVVGGRSAGQIDGPGEIIRGLGRQCRRHRPTPSPEGCDRGRMVPRREMDPVPRSAIRRRAASALAVRR